MMLHKVKYKDKGKSRILSTFTLNSNGNPHSARKTLHSKSTYFYNDGSRKATLSSSLAAFQRHPVGLCLLRAKCKSQDAHLRNAHPAQPGDDVLWKNCRQKSLGKISRLSHAVPCVCTLALLVGGIITINPILNNVEKASAEGEPTMQTNAAGESAAQADTKSIVSLTLTSGTAYQQTTAEIGKVVYRSNIFQVGGSGITHYAVSLNTASGKTGELVGKDNPYATIGKVGTNTIPINFSDNTWGYAVSTLNDTSVDDVSMVYNPVPSGMDSSNNSVEIARRHGIDKTSAVADSYKIAFAAKLGADLPADHYEADIYLSVVASPQETIANISTMQEMDSDICSASVENETKQLEDIRDRTNNEVGTGKKYWVTKLKDGNCWMTQNLDFDLSTSKPLSSLDSDVTGNWTPDNSTKTGNINSGWSSMQIVVQSWDPGDYYYKYVSDWTSCGNAVSNMSGCTSKGNWTTIAPAEGEHYHVGNYYSWNAATAGTGGSITSGQASSSICPKGWKLPTGSSATADFGKLMSAYELRNNQSDVDKVRLLPLYFTPAGYVNNTGGLVVAGASGCYWSSEPLSDGNNAYYFNFNSDYIYPSYRLDRYRGILVRCVAK